MMALRALPDGNEVALSSDLISRGDKESSRRKPSSLALLPEREGKRLIQNRVAAAFTMVGGFFVERTVVVVEDQMLAFVADHV